MTFGLPFIHEYPATVQIGVLVPLTLASYLNRRARLTIGGLTTVYIASKTLVPFVGQIVGLFKAFAMTAFYIYFFKIGIGYVNYVFIDGVAAVIKVLELARDGNKSTGQESQDSHDQ